jgi:hypothetical protein
MQQHLSQLDQLNARAQPWEVTQQLKQSVRDILATIPFLESMTADSFRERHWKQLLRLAGMFPLNPTLVLTIRRTRHGASIRGRPEASDIARSH